MADSMRINANLEKIDASKWKKLTPQEIIKEKSKGEEIPSELVAWAEQMAAFSKIPDNVTYEQVDGDTGIDALDKLGIDDPDMTKPEAENAEAPTATEEPDAVKDPAKTTETETDEEPVVPQPGQAADTEKPDTTEEGETDEDLTLADSTLNTDAEKIRKRKERKGLA